jgi:hypothetical protein
MLLGPQPPSDLPDVPRSEYRLSMDLCVLEDKYCHNTKYLAYFSYRFID